MILKKLLMISVSIKKILRWFRNFLILIVWIVFKSGNWDLSVRLILSMLILIVMFSVIINLLMVMVVIFIFFIFFWLLRWGNIIINKIILLNGMYMVCVKIEWMIGIMLFFKIGFKFCVFMEFEIIISIRLRVFSIYMVLKRSLVVCVSILIFFLMVYM